MPDENLETGEELDTSADSGNTDMPAADIPTTAEQQHEGLLAAVSAGIDDAGPAKPKEETADGETPTTDEAKAAAEAAAKAATDKTGETQPKLDKDGKPIVEANPAAKKPDVVNDPIPEGLRKETRERMQSLVAKVKELTASETAVKTQFNEIMGYIAESKATPEQYTRALDYLKAVNSGDPAQIKAVIPTIQAELRALSVLVGEPVQGVYLLSEHADLRDAVATGQITQQHAEELARYRVQRGMADGARQQLTEQQQTEQRAAQELEGGKAALNTLETELKKGDPQYATKREMLIPVLQPVFAQLHPSQWASAFRAAYDRLKLPAPSATVVKLPTNQPQPMRAKQGASAGAQKQPANLLEAITAGIEQGSRR
jgi:hypothetical protein